MAWLFVFWKNEMVLLFLVEYEMTNPAAYYQNYRKEMQLLLPEQYSKVLEVGCGEGNFIKN